MEFPFRLQDSRCPAEQFFHKLSKDVGRSLVLLSAHVEFVLELGVVGQELLVLRMLQVKVFFVHLELVLEETYQVFTSIVAKFVFTPDGLASVVWRHFIPAEFLILKVETVLEL